MNALDGCRLLVQRAREHSGELNASLLAFLSSQPYTFLIEFDHEKAEGILKFHVLREPDPTWSIHLGEIIHNLRSALDHLAFALAEIDSGPAPNPLPARGGWRNIQFPICDTAKEFTDKKNSYLWGINAFNQAIIESVQPYNGGNYATMIYLRKLSNIDKHRRLHPVATILYPHVGEPFNFIAENATVETIWETSGRIVEDGTILAKFRVRPTGPNPKVRVSCNFTPDIALDSSSPMANWAIDIASSLTVFHVSVSSILDLFANRFP